MPNVQSWVKTTTQLKRDVPIFINNGVWERIMLHTGISGSDLFSQGAVHFPTRLRMKPPLPMVSVVTWGYLKSLQTNRWQMRWNSWFMKIWTWAWLHHEKSTNAKLGWTWVKALMLQYLDLHYSAAATPDRLSCLSLRRMVAAVVVTVLSNPSVPDIITHFVATQPRWQTSTGPLSGQLPRVKGLSQSTPREHVLRSCCHLMFPKGSQLARWSWSLIMLINTCFSGLTADLNLGLQKSVEKVTRTYILL